MILVFQNQPCINDLLMQSQRRKNLVFLIMVLLGALLTVVPLDAGEAAPSGKSPKPNFVILLADDLGFETLGCYGGANFKGVGAVRTPNLDAMAKKGMLFKQCFATPVCSPARAELLTGKYNFRTGFPDIAGRSGAVESLDAQAHPTLPARLKAAGYVTAVAGKWHLGPTGDMHAPLEITKEDTTYPHPRECGFDRQYLFPGEHLEQYGKPTPADYTPARIQEWVLRFLEERKGRTEPFFLYYASPIPHKPLHPTPLNPDEKRVGKQNYPRLLEYLDSQVGEVLQKLEELGLAGNTLVLFSGDNGTHSEMVTEMRDGRKIKGGKAHMTDTGSHVPLLAEWPGVVKPGSVNDNLVDFTDILPTFLELAGVPPPPGIDGRSFASQLSGQPSGPREWIHSLFREQYFVRDIRWKLRENGELYDVSGSPFAEILVLPEKDTADSKAARVRLQAVLDELHPGKKGPVSEGQNPVDADE